MLTATKTDSKSTKNNAAADLAKPKTKEPDKNGFDGFDGLDGLESLEAVGVQTKLKIGQPGDKYEKEADAVADKVVSTPSSQTGLRQPVPSNVQKRPLAVNITPWVQKQNKEDVSSVASLSSRALAKEEEKEEPISDTLQKQEEAKDEKEIAPKFIQGQNKEDVSSIASLSSIALTKEEDKEEPITDTLQKQEEAKEEKKIAPKLIQKQQDVSAEASLSSIALAKEEAKAEKPPIQPKRFSPEANSSSPTLESRLGNSKGSGSPLPDDTRSFMETRIGADFSQAKVHTDSSAVQMNKELNAQAFTHGNDIYFNQGKYNPDSGSGKHLLAHELTHTVQQGATVRKQENGSSETETETSKLSNQEPVGEENSEGSQEKNEEVIKGPVRRKEEKTIDVTEVKTGFESVDSKANPIVDAIEQNTVDKQTELPKEAMDVGEKNDEEEQKVVEEIPGMKPMEEVVKKEDAVKEKKELGVSKQAEEAMIAAENSTSLLVKNSEKASNLAASGVFFTNPKPQPSGEDMSASLKVDEQEEDSDELLLQKTESTTIANQFLTNVAGQVSDIVMIGLGIRPRMTASADSAKSMIRATVSSQKGMVLEKSESFKSSAQSKSKTTLANIKKLYTGATNVIKSSTLTNKAKIKTEYDKVLAQVAKDESLQLAEVDDIYIKGADKFQKAGKTVGDEAKKSQYKRAWSEFTSKLKHESDGILDGPYTDDMKKARAKAAKAVGDGYRGGMIKEGEKQAEKLKGGKSKDVTSVRSTAQKVRIELKKQFEAAMVSLDAGEKRAIGVADKAKKSFIKSVNKSLKGTLSVLDKQEKALLLMLEKFGERQELAINRDMNKAIAALESGVNDAANQFVQVMDSFKSEAYGIEVPDSILLQEMVDDATMQLYSSASNVMTTTEIGIASSEKGILAAGETVVEGLVEMAKQGIVESKELHDGLIPLFGNLVKGARSGFAKVGGTYKKSTEANAKIAIDGIVAVGKGLETTYEAMSTNLTQGLKNSAEEIKKGLQAAVDKDMLAKSREEEDKSAGEVSPRWKKVLKVLLVILVIVVVALVLGPAVIGFVGAAAGALGASAGAAAAIGAIVGGAIVGAAAGAVIQMGNNVIDGKNLMEGVGKAIIVGAIGGALGGAGGALGQVLTKGAAGAIAPVLQRFGIDLAFDVGGGILGDIAVGNPITLEGILVGAAIGAGVSISMANVGRLGKFGTKVEGIQGGFMTKGTDFGVKMGTKVKAGAAKIKPPKVKVEPTTTKVAEPTTPKVKEPKSTKVEEPTATKSKTETPAKSKSTKHQDAPEIEPGTGIVGKSKIDGPGDHKISVTKDGKIIRCSTCAELELKYETELKQPKNADLKQELETIKLESDPEIKAKRAAELDQKLQKAQYENLSVGGKLARDSGLPEAESGYHWAEVNGKPVYKKNPDATGIKRFYNKNKKPPGFDDVPTGGGKDWQAHETRVVQELRQDPKYGPVGDQVQLKVTLSDGSFVIIKPDALVSLGNKKFQIVDAKHHMDAKIALGLKKPGPYTDNQSKAYPEISKGTVKSVEVLKTPKAGKMGLKAGLIDVIPDIRIHTNNPDGSILNIKYD